MSAAQNQWITLATCDYLSRYAKTKAIPYGKATKVATFRTEVSSAWIVGNFDYFM